MTTSWMCGLIIYFEPSKVFWLTFITDLRPSSTLAQLVIFIQGHINGCFANNPDIRAEYFEHVLQKPELQTYFLRVLATSRKKSAPQAAW